MEKTVKLEGAQGPQGRLPPVLKILCAMGISHKFSPEEMELIIMAEDPLFI